MKICERIYKVPIGHSRFVARVWCEVDSFENEGQHVEQTRILTAIGKGSNIESPADLHQVTEALAALPFCNAVEVKDGYTDEGVLIYPNWP